MSYEVLARKWRPRSFEELVGQEHVRRALVNALDRDQLHHAYLFTGTRGVGKTTIARILAKSLNCETHGVTSTPCGECSACREIDAGRFIDLIEVDAASRTKVEETRELLENVPYAPTRGRYKVYLIDEVHMFSGHSFNALLKTLEEPPAHVKFLLATTDPQKVPVTILSRCLQFNLKLMPVTAIVDHLQRIVAAEGIECDAAALGHIARAATGSMRDALSLLDQAIAYGQGAVRVEDVEGMLGTLSRERLFRMAEALADVDGQALLDEVEALAGAASDLEPVLVELQSLLHQIAVVQTVPGALDPATVDGDRIRALAERIEPAAVQLYHQIATHGRRDLAWAPDARSGLEMTLLRMLAFRPASAPDPETADPGTTDPGTTVPTGRAGAGATVAGKGSAQPAAPQASTSRDTAGVARGDPGLDAAEWEHSGLEHSGPGQPAEAPEAAPKAAPRTATEQRHQGAAHPAPSADPSGTAAGAAANMNGAGLDWGRTVAALKLRGLAGELAANTVLLDWDGRRLRLGLAAEHAHLGGERYRARLEEALGEHLGSSLRLEIDEEVPAGAVTPAEREQQAADERVREAERSIQSDPVVRQLQDRFGATLDEGTVRPGGHSGTDADHHEQ